MLTFSRLNNNKCFSAYVRNKVLIPMVDRAEKDASSVDVCPKIFTDELIRRSKVLKRRCLQASQLKSEQFSGLRLTG